MAIEQQWSADLGTQEGVVQAVADLRRQLASMSGSRGYIGVGAITGTYIAAAAIDAGHIEAGSINASHISAGAIETGHLTAGAVTAAKIAAGQITATHLEAVMTLSSQIRTGVAGSRMELDASGLRGYDTLNAERFRFDTATGSLTLTGIITTQAGSSVAVPHLTGDLGGGNLLRSSAFIDKDPATGSLTLANWTTFGASASSIQTDTTIPFDGANKARVTANTAVSGIQQTVVGVKPGDVLSASAYLKSVAATGRHATVSITWQTSGGSNISTDTGSSIVILTSDWTRATAPNFTAPATAAKALVKIGTTDAASTEQFEIAGPQLEVGGKVTGYAPRPAEIVDGAITTAKMVAGSIAGDRITTNSLAADRITTGTLSSAVVTLTSGGYLQTSGSNPRVVLDNSGLRAYNGSGVIVAEINSTLATFTGGTFQTAASGARTFMDSGGFGIDLSSLTDVLTIDDTGGMNVKGPRSSSGGPSISGNRSVDFLDEVDGAVIGRLIGWSHTSTSQEMSLNVQAASGRASALMGMRAMGSDADFPSSFGTGPYSSVFVSRTASTAGVSLGAYDGSTFSEILMDELGITMTPSGLTNGDVFITGGGDLNVQDNGVIVGTTIDMSSYIKAGTDDKPVPPYYDGGGISFTSANKAAIASGSEVANGKPVGNYDQSITMPSGFKLRYFIAIATATALSNFNVTCKGSRRSSDTVGLCRYTVATATTDVTINWIAIGEWT